MLVFINVSKFDLRIEVDNSYCVELPGYAIFGKYKRGLKYAKPELIRHLKNEYDADEIKILEGSTFNGVRVAKFEVEYDYMKNYEIHDYEEKK